MGERKYMEDCKWKTQDTAQEEQGQDQGRSGSDVCPVIEMLECNIHPEEAAVNKPWTQPSKSAHSGKEE